MNKSKIEWTDYTINPVKGLCKGGCSYCYAKRIYKRFKWNPEVRLAIDVMLDIADLKKPSKIFVCSTHDIMGDWIPDSWIKDIIAFIRTKPFSKHTYLFLTKNPKRYADFKFPDNCWLGTSITGKEDNQSQRFSALARMNNVRFISFEPLLEMPLPIVKTWVDWIIVGGLTPKPVHEKEWVEDIIKEARKYNIPIFLKNNLKWETEIKQFPKERGLIE